MADRDALLAGNASFYAAFARGDFVSMLALWADDDGISCVHPGWPALIGRKAVIASWQDILGSTGNRDIACHDPYAIIAGDDGRVLCIEAIGGHLLQATNQFRLIEGAWRLVHHQSSPISAPEPSAMPPGTKLN